MSNGQVTFYGRQYTQQGSTSTLRPQPAHEAPHHARRPRCQAASWAMCTGRIRQQPPIMVAPASRHVSAAATMPPS